MPYRPLAIAASAVVALSACGGTTSDTMITPPPVTFTTEEVARTSLRLENTKSYERNQDRALGGRATFSGAFLADLEIDFVGGQSLVGDIQMEMVFAEGEVTGSMTNFGIANSDGVATEGILGTIPLSGTVGPVALTSKPPGVPGSGSSTGDRVSQNILQVGGQGILSGTFGESEFGDVPIDLDLIGHARTRDADQRRTDDPVSTSQREWFSGVIGGDGVGAYDVFFDGRFYLIED